MPYQQPDRASVHVDTPMSQISIAYLQDQRDYVASRVFPVIPVQKDSDKFFVYDRSFWFRNSMKKRAMSTESAGGGWDVSTQSYSCENYGLHKDIDDRLRGNQDSPISLDRDATQWLSQQALINLEEVWAAAYFKTGVWTGDQTGVSGLPGANEFLQFNDLNSRPIETIRAQMRAIKKRTSIEPNKLVIGREVADVLVDHPDVVGRFDRGQTSGPAVANMQTIATLLGLSEVLVMNAVHNTAAEGLAISMDWIGGKSMLLAYAEPNPGIQKPTAGYTFASRSLSGTTELGTRITRMRMEHLRSDRLEIDAIFDTNKVAADLGVFFATAVA